MIRLAPFMIPEGEESAQRCSERESDGWMVTVSPPDYPYYARSYYYRTKGQAEAAFRALDAGKQPRGGAPFWPRHAFIR